MLKVFFLISITIGLLIQLILVTGITTTTTTATAIDTDAALSHLPPHSHVYHIVHAYLQAHSKHVLLSEDATMICQRQFVEMRLPIHAFGNSLLRAADNLIWESYCRNRL